MNLNKNKGISIVGAIIILALFHVLAFTIPVPHTVTFWLGYSFALFAALLFLSTILILFGKNTKEARFLNLPMVSIAWIYFVLQMILSVVQIFSIIPSHTAALIADSILSGIFLIIVLAVHAGISSISKSEQKTADKVFYLKELQTELELLQTPDEKLNAAIQEIAEMVRFSDPMSHSKLSELENKIQAKCGLLKECTGNPEVALAVCMDLKKLLAERSAKCKLLKGTPEPDMQKDNSGVKFVGAAFGVFGFAAVLVLVISFAVIPNNQYQAAQELFDDGQYSEAASAFAKLDGFRDSRDKIQECNEQIREETYLAAMEYYGDNQNAEALKLFYEIPDYKDSQKMIEQIYNRLAVGGEIYFGTYEGVPVAWKILKTEPDKMLLIAQEPVTQLAFHDDVKNITWETSTIREWLNNDFLQEFSAEQKADMLTDETNGLDDKVFLLSEEEYTAYLDVDFTTTSDWWLRTKTDSGMMFVYGDSGEVNTTGDGVVRAKGIRPCIWISLR